MLSNLAKIIDMLLLVFAYIKGRQSTSSDLLQDVADVKRKKDSAYSSNPDLIARVRNKYTRRD